MGLAPNDATYVTLTTNATLLNERVLTAGTGIALTDGGAGSTITVGVDATLNEILSSGSTTGGVDLEVTAGDSFILGENAATPWTPAAAKGCIWVKNDAPNTVWFTDDAGTDVQLGVGLPGDVVGPAGATDDNIATFDGATGKLIQDGGEKITDLLDLGGTRAMSGDLDMGTNAVTNVGNVDGRDVSADGSTLDTHVGSSANPHTVTLTQALTGGSTTSGVDLEVTAGDSFILGENAATPWTPAAAKGAIWVKNDTPNTLYFTDDAGTDFQLGAGGDLVGPAGATDDNLVTFDGATGKLVQDGGEKITDLLDLGGTRAMSGDLDMGTNAVTNVGNVDGRDVSADGSTLDTHVAATNNPHSTTLTLALTGGSTTSGVDLEVTAGDSFILGENAATPWTPAAGKGCIWIKNDAPNTLYFTDDGGTDHQLATGGDLDGPAGATDDNIATFDGATGKLVQDGGEKITDLLDLGGTRAMSGDLDMGTNAVTNVGNVDGRDVSADGSTLDTHVAATNNPHSTDLGNLGTGTLAELNTAVTDATLVDGNLAAVLAGGSTSGGTDLEISAGDALLLNENAAVPWTPAAGKGAIWVKNATPNELYFTDDAGTDFQLGAGASALDSYSQVNGDNGTGSSNNQILRFDTETSSAGSDITYTDSATNGGYWAISTTGIYAVSASLYEGYSASNAYAINVASALSNTFDATHIRAIGGGTTSLGDSIQIAWTGKVTAGDEIWISVDPDTTWSTSVSTNKNVVTVTRVQ